MSNINGIDITDPQDFTTTTGNNDDLQLSSSILWVTCTSDNDRLTGMVIPMPVDGAKCTVINGSASNALVIPDNDAGSTEGYRFILGGGSTTLTLEAGQGQKFTLVSGTGWKPVRPGTFT